MADNKDSSRATRRATFSSAKIIRLSGSIMSLLGRTLGSPIVAGSLLYVLTRGPESIRQRLLTLLRSEANASRLKTVLTFFLSLNGVQALNAYLNNRALNKEVPKWEWSQEIAVVTGGSNGIGAGVVKALQSKGVLCIVLDVAPLPADMQGYANIRYYECDISNPAAVHEVAERIKTRHGSPTILHNNAGISIPHTILNAKPEELQKVFNINVLGSWYTVQAFLPEMLERNKGHIITTASMSSFVPPAGLVDYASTKAAIMSFHEGLTGEIRNRYKKHGVKTSIVHPTYVDTRLVGSPDEVRMLQKQGGVVIKTQHVVDAIVKQILSGKSGRLILPEKMGMARYVRAFPDWMQEGVRDSASKHLVGAESGRPGRMV